MDLLLDYKNVRHLRHILKDNVLPPTVTTISAAIAYTQDSLLLDTCIQKKIHLNWWGLFTSDISTKPELVRKALQHSDLITFYPFAEYFHSKVIHFHGYGVYIGSHNMTYNALMENIEAGIFISEKDLSEDQINELNNFFAHLKSKSLPATLADVEKIENYIESIKQVKLQQLKLKEEIDKIFKEQFRHLCLLKKAVEEDGLKKDTKAERKQEKDNKNKLEFLQEWRETQTKIEYVQNKVKQYVKNPSWIKEDADISIVTDQILHVYYSLCTNDPEYDETNIEAVNRKFAENKNRTDQAILEAIEYWNNLSEPVENEDIYINEWAYSNKKILANLINRKLTDDELFKVFNQNHSAITHARQMDNSYFNLPKDYHGNIHEKCRCYVTWIQKQKSKDGLDINDVLKYLLYGPDDIENRVYNVLNNEHYMINHFKHSVVGEFCGWGRPDITHLRNNRVNKALKCLGFDVKLFIDN
ncbi:MAG: phospholipase D-like domain-containing protein [Spirochaetales bacterium]|nr:phospholipase D-like domain-containing protein [Spirochaetales bacterium]